VTPSGIETENFRFVANTLNTLLPQSPRCTVGIWRKEKLNVCLPFYRFQIYRMHREIMIFLYDLNTVTIGVSIKMWSELIYFWEMQYSTSFKPYFIQNTPLVQLYSSSSDWECVGNITELKTKLRGLSPHANYTDRAAAAGRRS